MYVFESIALNIVRTGEPASLADYLATPFLAAVLFWLAMRDIKERRLPDLGTLPLIAAGLMLGAWRTGGFPAEYILGAALGYGAFALVGAVYFRLRQTEGLGLGDAKLMSALGAWLGWANLPLAILVASVSALAMALTLRTSRTDEIAFGTYIAAAFFTVWVVFLLA